jgi:hypothetical protein
MEIVVPPKRVDEGAERSEAPDSNSRPRPVSALLALVASPHSTIAKRFDVQGV